MLGIANQGSRNQVTMQRNSFGMNESSNVEVNHRRTMMHEDIVFSYQGTIRDNTHGKNGKSVAM